MKNKNRIHYKLYDLLSTMETHKKESSSPPFTQVEEKKQTNSHTGRERERDKR